MNRPTNLAALLLWAAAAQTSASEVISGDLTVYNSACFGAGCIEGEAFGFDTIQLKSATPQILFDDTSSAGSFPNQDWSVGISDDGTALPSHFFIRNVTSGLNVLLISPDGDAAIGAGAELVPGAVSVGDLGSERRVSFVADATDDNDAVNLRQFQTFQTDALESAGGDVAALDDRVSALEERLVALIARLEVVAGKIK